MRPLPLWDRGTVDEYDGNESQGRRIARQLFAAWSEEQDVASKRRVLVGSIPAWVACVLSIGLLVWNAAVISGNVADNTRRISQLETDQRQSEGDNRQIIERMARIEAKLDIIVEDKTGGRR